MLRRRVVTAALVLATLLVVTAGCARDSRRALVVYSPHDAALRTALEVAFEREHPQVDVRWVELGSHAILQRVRAERTRPRADVWFGAPSDRFALAAREDLLAPYAPAWAVRAPAWARDDGGRWVGVYRTPMVIGFNRQAVSAARAPRDFAELATPAWRGRVVLRDPRTSGAMQALAGAVFARAAEDGAGVDAAEAWLAGLDANVVAYVGSPAALYQHLGRRTGVVTIWNLPELAALPARQRLPVGWRAPEGGVPVVIDGIAIVAGRPREDDARAFCDFVTSREGVLLAAREHNRWPVRDDLPAPALPAWTRAATSAWHPMIADASLIADSLDGWMRRWTALVATRVGGRRP